MNLLFVFNSLILRYLEAKFYAKCSLGENLASVKLVAPSTTEETEFYRGISYHILFGKMSILVSYLVNRQ